MREIGAAYDRAAESWRRGPERVYGRFADAMFADVAPGLDRVLDVGAGTGVVSAAALASGAGQVVAIDLAPGMLRLVPPTVHRLVGDATRLPFPDGAFDLVASAFLLSHLPDPVAGLQEMRRVGGAVLVSAFAPGPDHPAKAAVDAALAAYGFEAPWWYRDLKDTLAARVDDPNGLLDLALQAGLADGEVVRIEVDTGVDDAEALADWRLGMAHLAPFIAGLDPVRRTEARADAVAAVTGMPPLVVGILLLRARPG